MTGTMCILDQTGDTKLIWDSEKPDEVTNARRTFDDLKAKGYGAFSVTEEGDKGKVMRKFDRHSRKLILTPPLAGG